MQNKYNIVDIIEKKIKGKELEENEIRYVISAYVKEELPDYQMAALLTAIKLKGLYLINIVQVEWVIKLH